MGLGIPPLKMKIVLESNPLKSTTLVGRLGVASPPDHPLTSHPMGAPPILRAEIPDFGGLDSSRTRFCYTPHFAMTIGVVFSCPEEICWRF